MGLGDGDDVFDVGLPRVRKMPPRIGAVDPPAHRRHDAGLDRLRIGIVAAGIWRAAMFRCDGEPAPVVADTLGRGVSPRENDAGPGNAGKDEGDGESLYPSRSEQCSVRCRVVPSPILVSVGSAAQQGRLGAGPVEIPENAEATGSGSRGGGVHGCEGDDEAKFGSVFANRS